MSQGYFFVEVCDEHFVEEVPDVLGEAAFFPEVLGRSRVALEDESFGGAALRELAIVLELHVRVERRVAQVLLLAAADVVPRARRTALPALLVCESRTPTVDHRLSLLQVHRLVFFPPAMLA